jgi:outer membrane protein assembly factor BamB
VVNASSIGDLRYRWSTRVYNDDPECGHAQVLPVVAAGRAFIAHGTGIYAKNAAHGWDIWSTGYDAPDEEIATNLAVVGNTLIATVSRCAFGTGTTIYGFNAATGARLWSNTMRVNAKTMVVDKGIAAVGGVDDYDFERPDEVAAFRISDGARRWTRFNVVMGAEVSAGGRLLLSRTDVVGAAAVDITDNAQPWKTKKGWSARAANPAGDRFYVTDPAGSLIAIKPATGAVVWTVKKAGGPVSADGKRVYVARGAALTAYDPAKGKKLWGKTQAGPTGRPIRAGGLLYSVVGGAPMATLNAANGTPVGSAVNNQYARDHVVVVGGRVYFYDGASVLAYGL